MTYNVLSGTLSLYTTHPYQCLSNSNVPCILCHVGHFECKKERLVIVRSASQRFRRVDV